MFENNIIQNIIVKRGTILPSRGVIGTVTESNTLLLRHRHTDTQTYRSLTLDWRLPSYGRLGVFFFIHGAVSTGAMSNN